MIIKILTTFIVWLFTLPFFYMALIGTGPNRNIDKLFYYLGNLPALFTLPTVQLWDLILFPLSVLIAIFVLLAMNIGWLMNKKIHPYLVYLGSFFGIINSIFALTLTLWFGLGLLLIPGIWFAFYLVRWHLSSKSRTTVEVKPSLLRGSKH